MLPAHIFQARIAKAVAKIEAMPGWDKARLTEEIGAGDRAIGYWIEGKTKKPPFPGVVRLAEISGYPIGWFTGELSDEDAEARREFAGGAAELARTISRAIAEQSAAIAEQAAEIAGLRREMQAMRGSLVDRAVIAGPLGLPAAGETGGGELHDLRVAAGLSIQQVAVRLNISVKRAAEYEAGETPIEPEMLERWRDLTSS